MKLSIGVCAYNEEKNIGKILDRLLEQRLTRDEIKEILVISSGSTDNTDKIVREYEKRDSKIRLLTQERREGKSSAVDLFLEKATGDILILESGDTLPDADTIDRITKPFSDKNVGLVTGRPIPTNDPETFMGFVVNLIWRLHHELSMKNPKGTEISAFRPVIKKLDTSIIVDDLYIEAIIRKKGYKVVYAPDAIVYNRAPETLHDLIRQRKRNHIGFLYIKKSEGYSPLTTNLAEIIKATLRHMRPSPKEILWTLMAGVIELYILLLARFDFYILKRKPYSWEIAKSTKKP